MRCRSDARNEITFERPRRSRASALAPSADHQSARAKASAIVVDATGSGRYWQARAYTQSCSIASPTTFTLAHELATPSSLVQQDQPTHRRCLPRAASACNESAGGFRLVTRCERALINHREHAALHARHARRVRSLPVAVTRRLRDGCRTSRRDEWDERLSLNGCIPHFITIVIRRRLMPPRSH